jgi:CRP-like cAMP-binding protein
MDEKHTYLNDFFKRLEGEGRILSAEFRAHLEAIAFIEEYEQREQLQRRNQQVVHVWYVLSGVLRSRKSYERKDNDVTSWMWFPGQWAGVFSHLFSTSRSDRIIEAISKGVAIRFVFADFMSMRLTFPQEWQWLTGCIIEPYIRGNDNRQEQMMTLSARERYLQLLEEHPEVFQMINQREIASYLNVSREELSRLRAVRG